MLLLWPGSWELEEAVKKQCEEITSFLKTRPDPEARVPSSGRAAAGCSGWGRGRRRSGAPTSNRHVGNPLESLCSPGNHVFLRNGKGFCFCFGASLIQAQGVGTERKCGLRLFYFKKTGVRLTVRLYKFSAGLDVLAKTRDLFIGEIV